MKENILTIFDLFDIYNTFDLSHITIDSFSFKPSKENIIKYSNRLKKIPLPSLNAYTIDLRGVSFPKDPDFFQKSIEKSISNIYLPEADYSGYNFNNIIMRNTVFSENSILPNDINLFQKISHKDLYGTTLPKADYREYNFKNVSLSYSKFYEGTKLPLNNTFLNDLALYSVNGCSFPSDDYRNTDFSIKYLNGVSIGPSSIIPHNIDFFDSPNSEEIYDIILPSETLENIHLYNIKEDIFKNIMHLNNISLESIYMHKHEIKKTNR